MSYVSLDSGTLGLLPDPSRKRGLGATGRRAIALNALRNPAKPAQAADRPVAKRQRKNRGWDDKEGEWHRERKMEREWQELCAAGGGGGELRTPLLSS